jgi:hypothetical protein
MHAAASSVSRASSESIGDGLMVPHDPQAHATTASIYFPLDFAVFFTGTGTQSLCC